MQTSFTLPMALRVLLADESSTIKKVFQLALQDFAVEVQPVNVGLDVLTVARKFQPDIIFADVLLQKKNGYDVSADIKHDGQLQSTPVVLMWSGFMELDEDKYQASQADGHLEKPFDVKTLRALIHDLVPKTKNQKLSGFLSFPKMPEFINDGSLKPTGAPSPQAQAAKPQISETEVAQVKAARAGASAPAESNWNMDDFDPPPSAVSNQNPEENFKAVPLPSAREERPVELDPQDEANQFLKDDEDDNRWQRHDLGRFQIKEDLVSLETEDPVLYTPEPQAPTAKRPAPQSQEAISIEDDDQLGHSEIRTLDLGPDLAEDLEIEAPQAKVEEPALARPGALSEKQLEAIIRSQSKEIIEAVVWKIVPEIATTIIERELKRLLDERDQPQHF